MKHIITTLFAFFIISLVSCKGQDYFEGVITYHLKYSTTDPNINIQDIEKFYGRTSEFFYKDGNMKWNLEGKYWRNNIYLLKENKAFLETRTDTIFWENGRILSEKVVSSNIIKNATKIKGYECDELTLELMSVEDSTKRTKKFYFNNTINIDPNLFSNSNWNNFNFIYSMTKSLPLKIIDNFGGVTMEYEATNIEQKHLESSIFTINKLPLIELK
jgi:hypothetical protein